MKQHSENVARIFLVKKISKRQDAEWSFEMVDQPIEIFDGLVKGTVTGSYDFVTQVISPSIIPFSRKRVRFWKYVIEAEKRLSSTTCLALCIALCIFVVSHNTELAANHVLGFAKGDEISIAYNVIVSMMITVVFDLILRSSHLALKIYFHRDFTLNLKVCRLCIAFVFLTYVPFALHWLSIPFPENFDQKQILYLSFTTIPLAVVASRPFRRGTKGTRAIIALGIIGSAVLLIPYISLTIYKNLSRTSGMVFSQQSIISQHEVKCSFTPQNRTVKVSGFLLLERPASALINAVDVLVFYDGADSKYVGHGLSGQPSLVLTADHYVSFNLLSTYYTKSLGQESLSHDFQCHVELYINSSMAHSLGKNNGSVDLFYPPEDPYAL